MQHSLRHALDPTPGQSSCGVFAIGKHGVLIGGHGGMKTSPCTGDFADGVVLIHQYDEGRSTATVEECVPRNESGELNLREKYEQSDLMVGQRIS